jgi:hypothetical protein
LTIRSRCRADASSSRCGTPGDYITSLPKAEQLLDLREE